ncbi:MAG: UPF0149 family protein [Candidatus Competibacter denitrificans]|jgi:uncharacterized protein|uniref:YecA family protein n=1 Tax=Candidatus Competibacter denitrificans Run_A_D11 TaxID=1400863 RepID=W6M6Y2_9GAMM|nr:YecA family protein [Candidatus Competibacter denitrificans]CDI03447.1 conserved hypothetical protein [Candidatus Competibacter denitrificans Run_A_D11]HAS85531.1 YecA family protein [Candidatus Competibacteraceae bacterium]HRC69616.1 UPF0149 family protein [Candidatus Competibacter denitrificans]
MRHRQTHQPLSDHELNQLGDFLEGIGSCAMNLEMLDGFFAALICGPDPVPPSECLPEILGEDYAFDNLDQADEILGLILRHWNTIASALSHTLKKDDVYLPLLLEDEQGVVYGNDWADGFLQGVQLRSESWRELLTDDAVDGPLLPMLILAHEHDPDPDLRPPAIAAEDREVLLQVMVAALTMIYRRFAPHRRAAAQAALPRKNPKIGRNDPCPCGSGRKYKHCCAATPSTPH